MKKIFLLITVSICSSEVHQKVFYDAITKVIEQGASIEIVTACLEAGHINVDGEMDDFLGTPLMKAAESGNAELVDLLIKEKADIDKEDQYYSEHCRCSYSEDDPDPGFINPCQGTALIKAIKNGHINIVKILINNGASLKGKGQC